MNLKRLSLSLLLIVSITGLTACGNSKQPKTPLTLIGVHDSEIKADSSGHTVLKIKAPKNAKLSAKSDAKLNGSGTYAVKVKHSKIDFTIDPKYDSVIITVTAKSPNHRKTSKDVLVDNNPKLYSAYMINKARKDKASSIAKDKKDSIEMEQAKSEADSASKYLASVDKKSSQADKAYSNTDNSSADKIESNQDLSSSQIKTFNRKLAKGLKEDKKFANQGNDSYGWANSISSVRYDKNRGLIVQAGSAFESASNKVKTVVAHTIQGDASIALAESNIDYTDAITISFYDGNTKLGGSSTLNQEKMKWWNN